MAVRVLSVVIDGDDRLASGVNDGTVSVNSDGTLE